MQNKFAVEGLYTTAETFMLIIGSLHYGALQKESLIHLNYILGWPWKKRFHCSQNKKITYELPHIYCIFVVMILETCVFHNNVFQLNHI